MNSKIKARADTFLLLSRHFSIQITRGIHCICLLSSKPKNKKAKNKKITTTTGKKDSQILSNKNI